MPRRMPRCRPPPSGWRRTASAEQIGAGSGKDGRVTKGDVLAFLSRPAPRRAAAPGRRPWPGRRPAREERVKMTRLRRTIASRLKEAQNTAAMLTTFNEVDMSAAMALRTEYRDAFEKKHNGTRLGFMGFFVQRLRRRAEGVPGRQRRDRRRRDGLQELRPHGHRGRRRERPGGAGGARRRPDEPGADRARDRRFRPPRPRRRSSSWTSCPAAPSPSPMAASTAR